MLLESLLQLNRTKKVQKNRPGNKARPAGSTYAINHADRILQ